MRTSGADAPSRPTGRTFDVDVEASLRALADVERTPGVAKPDPILTRGQRDAHLRRAHGRRRRAPRGAAGGHHGPDRPERRREDHPLQPAHLLRPAGQRDLVLQRPVAQAGAGLQGLPDGHGAHLPADQGAVQADRDREHAGRSAGAEGREPARCHARTVVALPGEAQHHACGRAPRAVPPGQEAGGLRRVALRWTAQAPRDGAVADDRSGAGHARRADGRRQPGAQAVAARGT